LLPIRFCYHRQKIRTSQKKHLISLDKQNGEVTPEPTNLKQENKSNTFTRKHVPLSSLKKGKKTGS